VSTGPPDAATPPAPPSPTLVERVSGGTIGLVLGFIVGSLFAVVPAIGALGSVPWLVGGVVGAAVGAARPPRYARMRLPLPEAVPGAPVPIGALGAAGVRDLQRPTAVVMVIASAVAIGAIPLALGAYSLAGARPSLIVIGIVAVLALVAAIACFAVLPPLLLPPRERAAFAATVWLGAREFTRALGSPHAVRGFPTSAEAIGPWIAANPETDATREIHVELHLKRGDWEAARAAIDRMPAVTPKERFDRSLLTAILDYQATGAADEQPTRAAIEDIPDGADAVEARVALATFDARRRLPAADWREPLLEVRPLIPDSDRTILVRDHGAVTLRLLLRSAWPILAILAAMVLVTGMTVDRPPT
jgi:hypothetical protein